MPHRVPNSKGGERGQAHKLTHALQLAYFLLYISLNTQSVRMQWTLLPLLPGLIANESHLASHHESRLVHERL